jgi:VIT1/CCC1 family predicted Fe2+/Mn2+ transporter
MVLTFTLGAALAGGHERGLLLEAIGCNVAWGIIDAVLFVMSNRFERNRRGRLTRLVRSAPDEASALAVIRDELEPGIYSVTRGEDRERLYRSVLEMIASVTPSRVGITRADWLAGLAVFVLVAGTALPAALPFLLVGDPQVALRLSNAILVGLLFFVGLRWARHVDTNPWIVGLVMAGVGVALVAVAIALGG